VFNSLALSNLGVKDRETAMENMQKLLRDERLCEMDPWDSFYFYAWYRILEKSETDLVDMNTAVSIAFKRLQRRASRIENVEARRQYLNGSRWNSELCLAAKEFTLI
jgi:heme oxygenase